jgi:ABC-type glycerol-3-phosphate transport system permease component
MTAVNHIDFENIIAQERSRSSQRKGWVKPILALAISAIWVVPFYYVVISIFKSTEEYSQNHPLSLPSGLAPILTNAETAWVQAKMGTALMNSVFYGTLGGGLAVFIAALAAFGLSRIDFNRKNMWFMLIFAGTVFPFQMYLIPLFFGFQKVGILNTHFGLALFYTTICIPFPVLVLKNFMNGLSREMDEAARMDGANELKVFWYIVLPNCWGPMAATFLLQFTWIWNDLLFSTVLGNKTEVRSIMSALQVFQGGYAGTPANIILTATLIASAPSVLLFFLLRKRFMEGMRVSGV